MTGSGKLRDEKRLSYMKSLTADLALSILLDVGLMCSTCVRTED